MKTLVTLLIACACATATLAQKPALVIGDKPGWYKIAERHVNYSTDHDEVIVMGNNHFKQAKLKVKDAAINLVSFTIYYSDGTSQDVQVNKVLNPGEETTTSDINPNYALKRVALVYKTLPGSNADMNKIKEKERAEVEIWGLK